MSDDVLDTQLRTHPFVKDMAPDHVARLREHASLTGFKSGDVIFRRGDPAMEFYLLKTGLVNLQVETGGIPRTIQTITEGSVLGWSWLFEPRLWEFTAVAQTPVRAIAIDAAGLLGSCEEDTDFGYRLVLRVSEAMAERLHAARREVRNLAGP